MDLPFLSSNSTIHIHEKYFSHLQYLDANPTLLSIPISSVSLSIWLPQLELIGHDFQTRYLSRQALYLYIFLNKQHRESAFSGLAPFCISESSDIITEMEENDLEEITGNPMHPWFWCE